MTNLNVNLIIKAVDHVSRPVRNMQKSFLGMSGAIRGIQGVVAASGLPVIAAAVGRVGRAAGGVGREVIALTRRFTLLATVAGAALAAAVGRIAASGDRIAKTAGKLGVGIEALQEMQFAAGRAGISQETFNMALQRFTRRSAEAASGAGEAVGALKFLGVQLKDNEGRMRPAEELLGDVADAMAKIEDPAVRVRVAFKLFDSEGVSMVNMLKNGRAEMEGMRRRARELGFVMSKQGAGASVQYTDAMFDLRAALGGIGNVIGGELMPVLIPLIQQVTTFVAANRNLVRVKTAEFLAALPGHIDSVIQSFNGAVETMRPVMDIVTAIADAVGPLNLVLGSLGILITGKLIVALAGFVAALGTLGTALLTTPFGLFLVSVSAVAAGAALIVQNWDAIAAFFEELWSRVGAAFGDTGAWIEDRVSAVAGIADTLQAAWSGLGAFFGGLWDGIKATFAEAALFVLEKVQSVTSALPDFALRGLGLESLDGVIADLRKATATTAGASGQPTPAGVARQAPALIGEARRERIETRLVVDFRNAPLGMRVEPPESSARDAEYDVNVGYAMGGR